MVIAPSVTQIGPCNYIYGHTNKTGQLNLALHQYGSAITMSITQIGQGNCIMRHTNRGNGNYD